MRNQIIDSIFERMATDPSIFFLIADMGINLVEKIQIKYPDRFLNVGIAEQNLIGVSAGLANLGFRPFVYTISNFLVHRCFEQIRNDIILHNHPVTLLGTSAGFDNSPLGPTHHIVDEWGCLRCLPGIELYSANSVPFASGIVDKVLERGKPAYIRIPKGEFPQPDSVADQVHFRGSDRKLLLVSYGGPGQDCLRIHQEHPHIGCLIVNRLVPIDRQAIGEAIASYEKIWVVEDHFASTGLYGILCELANSLTANIKIIPRSPDTYRFDVGRSNDYFHRAFRFDYQSLLAELF
jgi:transketolase